jgi:hypothetical protein
MRRRFPLLLVGLLLTAGVSAQVSNSAGRVDLSGDWELADPDAESALPGYLLLSPLGDRGSIAHTERTLTIAPDGAVQPHSGEVTYALDASETRYARPDARGETTRYVARVSRVSAAFAIVTTTTRAGVDGWDDLVTLSIDPPGRLEIVRVTPNLWPLGTTSIYRWAYRRRME